MDGFMSIHQVSLVFGNVSEEDILLRDELEEMATKHKRFRVRLLNLLGPSDREVRLFALCTANSVACLSAFPV